MVSEVFQVRFNGYRNDIGANFTSQKYFRVADNVCYDDLDGANKILCPEAANTTEFSAGNDIDGITEYKYLDSNNVLQTQQIVVSGGNIYTNVLSTPVSVYSGMSTGKCRFAVLNDKLYIVNGKDYPLIYWGQKGIAYGMGAPAAISTGNLGNLNGTYRYAMTYVTSGGEEVIGSVSNSISVTSKTVALTIPVGYSGTTQRKIYRTEASGSTYKLVTTVVNNTDLTYTDNTADGSLGAAIPTTNNELPKPYFIETSYNRLVLSVVDKFPTQAFTGDTNLEMVDSASYNDISNLGSDNTAIVGMTQQFSKIILISGKNMYLLDASATTVTVKPTSTNIGCLDGNSVVNIPSNMGFPGGVMFLSTQNDIRVLNGLSATIPNTIDTIESENWAQPIKGTLDQELAKGVNIDAIFYNYTYYMIAGNLLIALNIKTGGWSTQNIETTSYNPTPKVFGILNDNLYWGLVGESYIEKMFADTAYHGEEITMRLKTASIPVVQIADEKGNLSHSVTSEYKYFSDIIVYFLSSADNILHYSITIDNDINNKITGDITLSGGYYDGNYFSPDYYDTGSSNEDYRVIRINRFGRWMDIELTNDSGVIYFRGYRLRYDPVVGKEQ